MVDGVGLTSLPNHSVVEAAGYAAEVLYVANQYGTNRTAIERAWAAGLPVMLNYEGIADDAKNGYPAGVRAANKAIVEAKKLGFDGDCPLPFSAADQHFADLRGAGLDYHRALVDVLTPIGWVGGAYGFKEMLELLAAQSWWPPDWPLWHWGGDGKTHYSWAWVKQGPGGSYWNETIGRQVDHNLLLKPMKFWSGDGPDPLDPQEEDMALTDAELARIVSAVSADTRAQINGFLGGDPAHAREGEFSNNLRAIIREMLKEVPPGSVDLNTEANQQALIRAHVRTLADHTVEVKTPGAYFFKRA